MSDLKKLTRAEVERMQDLYASSPLVRWPIDASLEVKGWVVQYGDDKTAVEPSPAAYTSENGRVTGCVLYLANGTVDPIWRDETELFGIWFTRHGPLSDKFRKEGWVYSAAGDLAVPWDEACKLVAKLRVAVSSSYEVRPYKETA